MATLDSSNLSSLTVEQVEALHQNDDVDVRRESHHHTLGPRGTQAAGGDHNHDGSNSSLLLSGMTISGSRSSSASILPSMIAGLVRLGMTDSSTA